MNQKDATSLPTLRISSTDHERLRLLVESMIQIQPRLRETLKPLSTELERAEVVPAAVMPANVARMGSQVEIEDQESGDVDVYTLVYPEQADASAGRISILVPLGMGVIGFTEGDTFNWKTPGGVRRLRLKKVTPPASE